MIISSLKNQKEFDLVNKYGVKLNGRYFVLVFADNFAIAPKNIRKKSSRTCLETYSDIGTKAEDAQKQVQDVDVGKTSSPIMASKCVRLGLKVGKKVGGAVVRNKIKRRARHLLRLVSKDLQHSCAIIFIPKRNVDIVSFDLLLKDFKKLLNLRYDTDDSRIHRKTSDEFTKNIQKVREHKKDSKSERLKS